MRATPSIAVIVLILLMTGCAAVDPYPPVSLKNNPDKKTLAAAHETLKAEIEPVPVALDEYAPDHEVLLAQIIEQNAPAAGSQHQAFDAYGEFWQQVRWGFRTTDTDHASIRKQIARYASNPHPIERTLKRGEPYLAYIRHEVEKRDLPAEVVLLPFVESGYDPFAYSHGRAAGLWQFIPSTGEYFGLRQDWWHDERRDVVASTEAALNYLDKLQKQFDGDWLLTFAAYNAGGGTVRNAIKRNRKAGKPTDFWHLDLPNETVAYVPKLLAICRIIEDPQSYGVELPVIDSEPGFAVIETGDQLDIAVAAELAGMGAEDFQQINPGFNRWATHPDGPHQLAIPVDKADAFARNLAELRTNDRTRWIRHKTVKGETLSHIARRYHTTVKVLQQSNNLDSSKIRAGSRLLVPVAAREASGYAVANDPWNQSNTASRKITHKVQTGDSLWSIAHRHQVSVIQLKEWNKIDAGTIIRPGQQLVIWKNSSGATAEEQVRTVHYAVRSGDSLYGISKIYNVSITDLQNWNKLHKDSYLQPGQNLMVHVDVTRLTE